MHLADAVKFIPHCLASTMMITTTLACQAIALKNNRSVLLLSAVHDNLSTLGTQKKPEVIELYNKYKSGVYSMDQMLGT